MRPPIARRAAAALLALAAAAALLLLTAVPASAHATMVSSTPTANKIVPEAPVEVVVKFSEPVSVVASGTGVTAPDGSKAHSGTPVSEGEQVRYPLRDGLADGTYVVSYRVISADGHPVPGGFTFSIGEESKVPEAADPGNTADPLVSGLVYANRYLGYAGLLLVLGPSLLLLAGNPGSRRGALRLTVVGLSLVAATAVIGLYLQAPYTAGTSLFGVTGADIGSVLGSRFGAASLGRMLLVLVALPLLRHALTRKPARPIADSERAAVATSGDRTTLAVSATAETGAERSGGGEPLAAAGTDRTASATVADSEMDARSDAAADASRGGGGGAGSAAAGSGSRWLLIGVAVALAATWPISGHATTSAAPALTVLSDTVHIAAATVWLGGLLTLAFYLVKPSRTPEAEAFLPTWSRWATWIVASLAIAGLAQALIHVGTASGLVSTTYGRLVIAKLALFAVLLGTAALARKAVARIGTGPVVPRVRRIILLELVVGALVLGLSTVLVQAVPAQSTQAGAADQGTETFSKTFKTDEYVLQFELEPVAVGQNEAHLYLFEPDGVTELEAKEWQASFGRPKDGIELVPFDLALLAPNHTSGDVAIPQAGKWTFEFTIRVSKLDRETVSTVVSVT